jgi:hypothetical protein
MPDYNTDIHTVTRTERQTTQHTNWIDWEYTFEMSSSPDAESRIREAKEYLRTCERCKEVEVMASNYGGWPRIWHRVFGVGMVSMWPYWRPRPCVLVEGTLGTEWYDWASLTGAKVKGADRND